MDVISRRASVKELGCAIPCTRERRVLRQWCVRCVLPVLNRRVAMQLIGAPWTSKTSLLALLEGAALPGAATMTLEGALEMMEAKVAADERCSSEQVESGQHGDSVLRHAARSSWLMMFEAP